MHIDSHLIQVNLELSLYQEASEVQAWPHPRKIQAFSQISAGGIRKMPKELSRRKITFTWRRLGKAFGGADCPDEQQ